jgi:peptidoglycan/LPS O-acetylase OafA/YrhL
LRVESPNQSYVAGVDHLRAFAALLIVAYHGFQLFSALFVFDASFAVGQWVRTTNPLGAVLVEGHTAVALFMVLSGFIFSRAALGRTIRYGAFIRNRLLRIYPLFVLLLVTGIYIRPETFTPVSFAQTLLLGANLPGGFQAGHLTVMFWAIAVECQFYVLFPFLHGFLERLGWRWLAGALLLCLLVRAVALLEGAQARNLSYFTLVGRLDQFLLGMALARSMRDHARGWRPWILPAATAAVIAALTIFHRLGGWPLESAWKIVWPPVEGVVWALFIGGYLTVADRLPALVSGTLAAIGTVSYSIYLLHFVVIGQLVGHRWGWQPTGNGHADALLTTAFLVTPIVLAASALTYQVVERPFLRLRGPYLAEARNGSIRRILEPAAPRC